MFFLAIKTFGNFCGGYLQVRVIQIEALEADSNISFCFHAHHFFMVFDLFVANG